MDAPAVTVEVHLANGLPAFAIVGLADTEVRESRDRVRAALHNAGFDFPPGHITVNLAPADRPILFVPDENLGAWVMEQTGRKMDLWKGNCYVHVEFTRDSINRIKAEYPDALVVAHPECTQAVRLLADEVCSTEKMVTYCQNAPVKDIIVVTESGMLHRLRKECPDKNLIAGPTDRCACADCRYMKMNTLQKLRDCLDKLQPRVEMEEPLRARAELPLLRMLEQSK